MSGNRSGFFPGWADAAGKAQGERERSSNAELGAVRRLVRGRAFASQEHFNAHRDAEQCNPDPDRSRRGGQAGARAIRAIAALDRVDAALDQADEL